MKFIGSLLLVSMVVVAGCSKHKIAEQEEKLIGEAKNHTHQAITADKRDDTQKLAGLVAKKGASKESAQKTEHKKFPLASLKRGYISPTSRRSIEDRIVARVNGENILLSDINEQRIDKDGKTQTLEEAIAECLFINKAIESNFKVEELEVEKRIVNWKDSIGFGEKSEEEFESWLQSKSGLTIKRAKRQLRRMMLAEQVKSWLLNDKGFVSPKKVKEHFEHHPEYQDERYDLRAAFRDDEDVAADGKLKDGVEHEWIDLGWLDKSHLSERMKFISSMKKDEISAPFQTDRGYQVIQLLNVQERRLKTFEEREIEITKLLNQKEVGKAEHELVKQLKDKASIVYLNPL